MAEQLLFVRTYDFEADQDSVSLLNRTDGFEPAYGGWTPNVTASKKGFVSDAITVRVQGTSTDHIASNLQKLADKAEEVQRYIANGARDYAVWFRVQMYGETKGRQTLVQELRHEPASSVYDVGLRNSYHWNQYIIGIDRAPWWEGTACGTVSSGSVSIVGGTFAFGTVKGDLDARIAQVKFTQGTQYVFPYGQSWVGVKSNRYGAASSVNYWWSLSTPTYPANLITTGDLGSNVADATAKGGTSVVFSGYSGATAPLRYVRGLQLSALTTSPQYYRGDYKLLLRARLALEANTTEYLAQIRLAWAGDTTTGFSGDMAFNTWPNALVLPRVTVSNTYDDKGFWHLYDMGDISIPGESSQFISQASLSSYAIILYAQRVSGTASIYFDGFVAMPRDGYMWAGNQGREYDYSLLALSSGSTANMYAVNGPDGRQQAVTLNGTVPISSNNVLFVNGIPPGTGGIVVVAGESYFICGGNLPTPGWIGGNYLAGSAGVEIKYFERWKEIRGND